jgi:hypothetical protein
MSMNRYNNILKNYNMTNNELIPILHNKYTNIERELIDRKIYLNINCLV